MRYRRLIISLLFIGLVTTGCGSLADILPGSGGGKYKVALVANIGGLNDNGLNYWANEGMEMAKEELDLVIEVGESQKIEDYESNLRHFAEKKFDLIIAAGSSMENAVINVAADYPEIKFLVIDSELEGYPNITALAYRTEQAGYAVGVMAGLLVQAASIPYLSGSDAIGIIGGIPGSPADYYIAGFIQGVRSVNPEGKILLEYTGRLNDPGMGNTIAKQLIESGTKIIFQAAEGCGTGVFDAATVHKAYVIGADTDQGYLSEYILSSALKNIDYSTLEGIKMARGEGLAPGICFFGYENGGVEFAPVKGFVPEEIKVKMDEVVARIKEGSIAVSQTIPEGF